MCVCTRARARQGLTARMQPYAHAHTELWMHCNINSKTCRLDLPLRRRLRTLETTCSLCGFKGAFVPLFVLSFEWLAVSGTDGQESLRSPLRMERMRKMETLLPPEYHYARVIKMFSINKIQFVHAVCLGVREIEWVREWVIERMREEESERER